MHTFNKQIYSLRRQFFRINKNILLVFIQQNSFIVPTKHFAISIKFWLLKQNVLLGQPNFFSGQQNKFCCINFVLNVPLLLMYISISKKVKNRYIILVSFWNYSSSVHGKNSSIKFIELFKSWRYRNLRNTILENLQHLSE